MGLYIGSTIRATKKIRSLVMYTCSKCNKYNQFTHDILGEGKVFTISKPNSEKTQSIREKACAIAEKNLYNNIKHFEKKIHNGEYVNLRLEHSCTYCKHVEPWVSVNMKKDRKRAIPTIITLTFVIAGMGMILVKPMLGSALMAVGALAGMLIDSVLIAIKKKRVKKECIKLPESALPRIRKYL